MPKERHFQVIIIMELRRQQLCPSPKQSIRKRKSVTLHITKQSLKRKDFKTFSDFNSQLLSGEAMSDFNHIVNTIKRSSNVANFEFVTPSPKRKDRQLQSPLQVVRYSYMHESMNRQRIPRIATEGSFQDSPHRSRQRKHTLPSHLQLPKEEYPKPKIKIQLKKLLPIGEKLKEQGDTTYSRKIEIIKPWETKRDLFHETFKRYISEGRHFTDS